MKKYTKKEKEEIVSLIEKNKEIERRSQIKQVTVGEWDDLVNRIYRLQSQDNPPHISYPKLFTQTKKVGLNNDIFEI